MAAKKPSISVHVKLTIDPSRIEEFLRALRPTFEEISADPLNTFIEIYRDDKNPGVFKLVENWDVTPEHMLNVRDSPREHIRGSISELMQGNLGSN
jgi:quinol monooxygenase YgiN